MKFEDLKEGSFFRWTANRMFKAWDTFGKVISVTDYDIIVMTYDDFKETKLSKTGDSIETEISLCDKSDVSDYLELQVANLSKRKASLKIDFKRNISIIDKKLANTVECIDKLFSFSDLD